MASLLPANTDIATRQELVRVEAGLRRDLESHAATIMQAPERRTTTAKKHRVTGHGGRRQTGDPASVGRCRSVGTAI